MSKERENNFGGVFPDEETFQKIYSECLEKQPQATDAIRTHYDNMQTEFEEYLCAIEENLFRYAYQCGWEAAIAEIKKGGAA